MAIMASTRWEVANTSQFVTAPKASDFINIRVETEGSDPGVDTPAVGWKAPSPRLPLCACCRSRHKVGSAEAHYDRPLRMWLCSRCHTAIEPDGDCQTPRCCGHPTPTLFDIRIATPLKAESARLTRELVAAMKANKRRGGLK